MDEDILYVQSRRLARVKLAQTMQHVLAAVILVAAGVGHVEHNTALAVAEIVAGALLIVAVIFEKRKRAHHTNVAWVELAGAFMMLVEAIEKTRGPHHVSFIILAYVGPLILFVFALFDADIAKRRYIKVDDRGVELRLRLLFRRRVPWSRIQGYRVRDDRIEFGERTLKLNDVLERDRAKEWLIDALRKRGISELPA